MDLKVLVLWTALSVALGLEVRGEVIRGLPCITRFNQLFCRSGGTNYPSDSIERFIDDNKALIRRMYGEFIGINILSDNTRGRKRRSIIATALENHDFPYLTTHASQASQHNTFKVTDGDEYHAFLTVHNDTDMQPVMFNDMADMLSEMTGGGGAYRPYVNVLKRSKRQTKTPGPLPKSDRMDSCESEEEVATPYWASNSRGKILAVVNTNEFSQIIHQEICTKTLTKRCRNDCGCEQKYKYHRLMAYDPDNDCKGIFMDWFLFPSCCACRCDP